jgi:hypothetical protein
MTRTLTPRTLTPRTLTPRAVAPRALVIEASPKSLELPARRPDHGGGAR